ncbi:MAG: hypothetical protein ABI228_05425, partial [Burkholderiaceae bacterium]
EELQLAGHDVTLVNGPVRYDGERLPTRRIALAAGADTRAILADLGLSTAKIDDLVARCIVAAPPDAVARFSADDSVKSTRE